MARNTGVTGWNTYMENVCGSYMENICGSERGISLRCILYNIIFTIKT